MRIISGKFKGKKISFINSVVTRPLRDYVKENIFNIITHRKNISLNLDKAKVLDLYSGVGSFGIECLSRNVKKVVFVEKDPKAFAVLKKNIIDLNFTKRVKLVSEDIINYIENSNFTEKFDLIFLDPPYKDAKFLEIISLIKEKKIFNKYHKIIIHREQKSKEMLEKVINIELEKNYGRSRIIFGSF